MPDRRFRRQTLEEHLFGPGPKRMLALDGGGVLGVIEIAYLERIEAELRRQHGDDRDFRLADYFDLIGGTSTGSIIATGLALGWTVDKVRDLYFEMAPSIFGAGKSTTGIFSPVFSTRPIADLLRHHLGERGLDSPDLKTGLAITTKRVNTASSWVLLNSPKWTYWDDRVRAEPGGAKPVRTIGNRHLKLRDLVRASTAAPYYFAPEKIRIAQIAADPSRNLPELAEDGVFVDGGLTPHNNPSLQLLMLARMKPYGLNWRLGRDELLIVSIGTGWIRPSLVERSLIDRLMPAMAGAFRTLRGLSWDCQIETLKIMQWLSRPSQPWRIDSELDRQIGEQLLSHAPLGGQKELLSFQRYDVPLPEELNDVVNPEIMQAAHEHARIATRQPELGVSSSHFSPCFHLDRVRAPLPQSIVPLVDRARDAQVAGTAPALAIGVTGHRLSRFDVASVIRIRRQLSGLLDELQSNHGDRGLMLVSGLAEGSDRLAAAMALDRGWQLFALLPFSRARYLKDFESLDSRDEFEKLSARACAVSEAPLADGPDDPGQAYLAQGRGVVAASRGLIAIWDGKPSRGPGGTAEIVAEAVANGLPVYWINSEADVPMLRL